MASRTRSLSNSRKNVRKGQFFVLTTVAVVTILFFVGRWTGPLTQVDTSEIVLSDELFTFDNIKEKTNTVIKNSENCNELNYNLQEYKNFIDNFAREKNYKITFAHVSTPCDPELGGAITEVTLKIVSDKVDAKGTFSISWP